MDDSERRGAHVGELPCAGRRRRGVRRRHRLRIHWKALHANREAAGRER